MNLRENLPARVAVATTGLLALVLLLITGAAYVMTALMVRQGIDTAMANVLPRGSHDLHDAMERANRFQAATPEDRHYQVLNPHDGHVQQGAVQMPVDPIALERAMANGQSFTSLLVKPDGTLTPRTGPDWWQALTPRAGEVRVMYVTVGHDADLAVMQFASPIGPVGEILPGLLQKIMLLAIIGAAVCGVIAWRMVAQTYKPLRAITATADQISTQTLSMRVPDRWHDTTLRRLTGVLNAMMGRLQDSFERQGRFVAAAAHELRSPLAAMRAELEVTLRRERNPEDYKEALEGALDETKRLGDLAEKLLILARYERGMGMAVEKDVSLQALLERTVAEIRRSVPGNVEVSVPDDLLIDADPIAVERVVSNLIRNGLQAGGDPVTVAAAPSGDGVLITVADNGSGIPAEAVPKLFDPFYRADPARKRDGGTGLGLAIVKTITDAHGGTVSVESEPGQGTTFRVWLPRHQEQG